MPVLAGLMAHLLDVLGHDEADVLGYSWGGALAQQFAAQHPARCRRLVLISTNTGAGSVLPQPTTLAALLVPRRVDDAAAAARLDVGPLDDLRTALSGAVPGAAGATGWWGYATQLGALMAWSSLPFLPFLTQPTLVLSGADDAIVPVANARLDRRDDPRSVPGHRRGWPLRRRAGGRGAREPGQPLPHLRRTSGRRPRSRSGCVDRRLGSPRA